MVKGILLAKTWSDDDVVELRVAVSDGISSFVNQVYVGHGDFSDAASGLSRFKDHVHGGLVDVHFGEFGPEYAKGAFHARFHFPEPGRLYITIHQESAYTEFARRTVASCATLYLVSEPALLDRFIVELSSLANGERDGAYLEAV